MVRIETPSKEIFDFMIPPRDVPHRDLIPVEKMGVA